MTATLLIAILLVLSSFSESKYFPKSATEPQSSNEVPVFSEDDVYVSQKDGRTESLDPSWINFGDPKLLWKPQDIPFFIDPNIENYSTDILSAVKEFTEKTCLRFRRLFINESDSWPVDFLHFNNSKGCASFIGRQGGDQLIAVQAERCTGDGPGTVMHLIFHALGFGHEHNRPDRDRYIKIHWTNVNETKRHYLFKYYGNEAETTKEPYDYGSLLHGSNTIYAINRTQPTITATAIATATTKDGEQIMGQRDGLSVTDVHRIKARYCKEVNTISPSLTTTTPSPTTTTMTTSTTAMMGCDPSAPPPTCDEDMHLANMADPTNCAYYYVCEGVKPTRMMCPVGLYYNPLIYVCDWPFNVDCCMAQRNRDRKKTKLAAV